jgi:hypothetical protein
MPATPTAGVGKSDGRVLRVSDSGNQPFLDHHEEGWDAGEERADHATITIHVAAARCAGLQTVLENESFKRFVSDMVFQMTNAQ